MTNDVRLAVPKPLIFSSAFFSLVSFPWRPSVAVAKARPNIPAVLDCGLFIFEVLNADEDCDITGKRGLETAEEILEFPSSDDSPAIPKVKDGVLVLISLISKILLDKVVLTDEVLVEGPKLLNPPKVRLVEDGCLTESPSLNMEPVLVLSADETKAVNEVLLGKIGFDG